MNSMVAFDQTVKKKILDWLTLKKQQHTRKIAVFDADGTLWSKDLGEAFFEHQVLTKKLKDTSVADPWKAYWDAVHRGKHKEAYSWLLTWNAGTSLAQIYEWASSFYNESFKQNIFQPMRQLVHQFHESGFEVWIVTASMKWLVEIAAKDFGISKERVIGTTTYLKNDMLTDCIELLPFRDTKVTCIQKIIGDSPLFVAGNTFWDKDMLCTATELALAIHSEDMAGPNFESEQKLKELALVKNWLIQKL